jgi:hypothetical protein
MHAFFFPESVLSGAAMTFFERGYLFKNSTRLCHDLKLGVYGYEPMGISCEHIKPLILSHY